MNSLVKYVDVSAEKPFRGDFCLFKMVKNKTAIRDEFEKLASISGSQLQQPCYGFLTYTMVANHHWNRLSEGSVALLEFRIGRWRRDSEEEKEENREERSEKGQLAR